MGMFAETAIADHRFLFADQGNELLFFVSISSVQTEIAVFH
jgi:hypothetical protein